MITTINKIRSSSGARQTTGTTSNSGKLRHPPGGFLWVGSHLAMIVTMNKILFSSAAALPASGTESKSGKLKHLRENLTEPKKPLNLRLVGSHLLMIATMNLIRSSSAVARLTSGMESKSGKLRLLLEEEFLRAGSHLLMTATTNLIRSSCAVASNKKGRGDFSSRLF